MVSLDARWWTAVAVLGAVAACGRAAAPATTLPVLVLAADPSAPPAIGAALTAQPIDQVTLTASALPPRPTDVTPAASPTAALGAARAAYLDAQPEACLAAVATLDVGALLAAGQREAAARLLVLQTACQFDDAPAIARATADAIAIADLELPAEVGFIKPPVERLLDDARQALGARPLVPLAVTSTPTGAALALDGKLAGCTTPCTLRVRPGDHVVVAALDGYDRSVATAAADGTAGVTLALVAAPPEIIGAQVRARLALGGAGDDVTTLRLAAAAVRAPRLLVIAPSAVGDGVRLVGALFERGVVTARGERRAGAADLGASSRRLARDVLVEARYVASPLPVWRRWPFWVGVTAAALAAGAATFALVYQPNPMTTVTFPPAAVTP